MIDSFLKQREMLKKFQVRPSSSETHRKHFEVEQKKSKQLTSIHQYYSAYHSPNVGYPPPRIQHDKVYIGLECLIPSKRRQPKSSHSELHLKILQLLSLFQERINHCLSPNFSPLNSQVTQKPFAIPYKTHLQVNKYIMQKYHKNTKFVLYYQYMLLLTNQYLMIILRVRRQNKRSI